MVGPFLLEQSAAQAHLTTSCNEQGCRLSVQWQPLVSQCPQRVPGDKGSESDSPGCQLWHPCPNRSFPVDTPAVGLSSSVGCVCWGAQRASQGLMFPSQSAPVTASPRYWAWVLVSSKVKMCRNPPVSDRSPQAPFQPLLWSSPRRLEVPKDKLSHLLGHNVQAVETQPPLGWLCSTKLGFIKMKVSLQSISNM